MRNVFKNFLYNSAYQLLIIFIPLITTPYLSRVIGASGVGQYSYAYSIAYFFAMFIILGLNNYGNRTIAILQGNRKQLSKAFCSIYAMQICSAFICISLYLLYSLIFSTDRIISLILLGYVISAIFDINWFFFGLEKFKLTVVRNTVVKLLSTAAIFVFVESKDDVYIYAIIMVSSFLVSQLIIWPFLKKEIDFIRPTLKEVLIHVKPNIVLFVPVVAVSLYKYMDKIMLGGMTNITEVGFFDSAEKIIYVPIVLVSSLGTVMIPRMSNMVASNKKNNSQQVTYISVLFVVFLTSSLCMGILSVVDIFVPLFFGSGFEKVSTLLLILMPSCIFLAFANVIRTQFLIPMKKDKIYITTVFCGAIVNLVINALLIPTMQSIGAAIGTLCAEVCVCLLQAFLVRKQLPIGKYIKNCIPFIFSGLITFLITYNITLLIKSGITEIILKIIISCAIYVLTLVIQIYILKGNYQDIIILLKGKILSSKRLY
jgi:O-antigen/teichoic acid export membrane protein